MRYSRLIQVAGAAVLVAATASIVHNLASSRDATHPGNGTAAAAPAANAVPAAPAPNDPQRRGGGPPSGQRSSGPPPSAHRPAGPPPSQAPAPQPQPRTGPPQRAPQPRGTTGRVPPEVHRPDAPRHDAFGWRGHAPDAPLHQRVYPVPGIHEYRTPRAFIPHHHYPRPYYSFYPQYWLGFGLYGGYALSYPLIYGYPSYIYDGGTIEMLPPGSTTAVYGGISFEITPEDAVVLVDGVEVGTAADFSATEQPLTLRPGRHHIELRATGMQPVAFDVVIVAGQVLPFSGVLEPR